ncbi:MAG: hypothetical protein AAFX93_18330 [Verrucomicrobiota bacterium]
MSNTTNPSLRTHPDLANLLRDAEARNLTDEELDYYRSIVPEYETRANAASEIQEVGTAISGKIAKQVTTAYRYDEFHDLSTKKCFRDISLTVKYATLAMLMGDPNWLRDKMLVWFKTILQSFRFPDIKPGDSGLNNDQAHIQKLEDIQPFQRSIFETYTLLDQKMKEALTPESYQEIAPYLNQAIDILSND